MFKNKPYLNGLGVGLIIGAVMLQLMIFSKEASSEYSANDAKASATPTIKLEDMDKQKLKAEAAKSFQVFEKNEKVYTQVDFDADLQKKLKEEKDKLGAASPEAPKRTYVYIQPNLPASSVAELLYNAEIVSDRRALLDELSKQDAMNKLQVGTHVFEGAPDLHQVIKNITTAP